MNAVPLLTNKGIFLSSVVSIKSKKGFPEIKPKKDKIIFAKAKLPQSSGPR